MIISYYLTHYNYQRKLLFVFIICYVFLCNVSYAQLFPKPQSTEINIADTFPTPPENKSRLFYIQRTSNLHTIIYEANYKKDSTLNEEEPLTIYWLRYATKQKGEYMALNTIQRKLAYGITSSLVDKDKKIFKVNLVSYKKLDIFLISNKYNKKYNAYVTINGKLVLLSKIFIKIDGGSMLNPNVVYIELYGKDVNTGKKATERFKP